jgi:hypothetical protein
VGAWTRHHALSLSLGAGALALHGGVAVFFAARNPYAETIFPPCPLLHLTGWQCPGCGGTRSLYSLFHGDVLGSLAMNPMVIAGYLAVAIALLGVAIGRTGRERMSQVLYWVAAGVALGAVLYSALIRNLLA